MAMHTLKDAFVGELRDVYNAEMQLVKALPKMAQAATDNRLRAALEAHLDETQTQVKRIEKVFESLEMTPQGKKCEGIAGILEEANEHIEDGIDPKVLDAVIIAAAQKVEHYEIGTYGALCAWAQALGLREAHVLLRQNLTEEKDADLALSEVARSGVNRAAILQ